MPITGALAGVFPLRLGGNDLSGWTAAQHARFCADLVAVNRTVPLATFTYTKSGAAITITNYTGRQGSGLAHKPTSIVNGGTGVAEFRWDPRGFPEPYDETRYEALSIKAATASVHHTGRGNASVDFETVGPSTQYAHVIVRTTEWNSGGGVGDPVDRTATVKLFGTVGASAKRAIGDYAGDPNKEDSKTEGDAPYSEFILREIRALRGTAYSKEDGTLVDVENVALARFWSAIGPRLAEKFRANAVPGRSDERLPYWERFLAVPKRLDEPKWRTRQKLATHYKLSEGSTVNSVRQALEDLLGEAFVDMSWSQGPDLANPPAQTFWPTINPGDASLSLGGGAWTSERCALLVEVVQPAGMSDEDFLTMMNVEFFILLDRMLPVWATFNWAISDSSGGGFFLDVSRLDYTALT